MSVLSDKAGATAPAETDVHGLTPRSPAARPAPQRNRLGQFGLGVACVLIGIVAVEAMIYLQIPPGGPVGIPGAAALIASALGGLPASLGGLLLTLAYVAVNSQLADRFGGFFGHDVALATQLVLLVGINLLAGWLGERLADARSQQQRTAKAETDLAFREIYADTLRESEERFRALTRLSADFYWETDAQHRFSMLEYGAHHRATHPRENLLGKTRWDTPYASPGESEWREHRETLDRHEPFRDFRFSRIAADGEERFYEISGEPMFDRAGRFTAYRGVGQEITGRVQAERAVLRANARLQLALEASRVSFWDTDLRTGQVYLSEGWSELVGEAPGETRTTVDELLKLVHPEDVDTAVGASMKAAKGSSDEYVEEHRVRTRTGQWRWVLCRGKVVERATGGRALRMIGTNIDITDRKRAEDALRQSEARFRSLSALSSDWFWEQDENFRFTAFSGLDDAGRAGGSPRHAHEAVGSARWEIPGMHAVSQTWEEHRADLQAHRPFRNLLLRHDRPGLPPAYLGVNGEPVFDPAGRFTGYRGTASDVTERVSSQQALAESELRFRTMFERHDAVMLLVDAASGAIADSNASAARFYGYTRERLRSMNLADLNQLPADQIRAAVADAVANQRNQFTFPHRLANGEIRWVEVHSTAIPYGGRQLLFSVIHDVTDAKAARAHIERMNAELEERVAGRTAELQATVKELDAFTYSVSHDLRAPLGAINGFANLLRMKEADRLTDEGRKLLGFVEHNAERMAELVEDLLALSRIGRLNVARSTVAMEELAREAASHFAAAPDTRIEIGALPDCQGEPPLLRQVWENLIGNACKYSRGRHPARIEIGFDAGANAYFVRDNGVGFDMQYANKLFGAFERLHSEAEFEGTGIGLAIVERIVQRHGGCIWAQAAPGVGATFWFTVAG